MKSKTFRRKELKTLLFYNILFLIVAVVFVRSIPRLLSYPPNSINTEFERHIDDGFYYDEQGVAIVILAMITSNATFLFELRKIRNWEKYSNLNLISDEEKAELEKIKKLCYIIPTKLYFFHAFVPAIATAIGLLITRRKVYFSG